MMDSKLVLGTNVIGFVGVLLCGAGMIKGCEHDDTQEVSTISGQQDSGNNHVVSVGANGEGPPGDIYLQTGAYTDGSVGHVLRFSGSDGTISLDGRPLGKDKEIVDALRTVLTKMVSRDCVCEQK